jgi:hypothetical protein
LLQLQRQKSGASRAWPKPRDIGSRHKPHALASNETQCESNVRLPQALKFTEITALVPFSTATGDFAH